MKVSAITCNRCGDTVYSRAHHDFRRCSCKAVAADGGVDYFKVSFTPGVDYSTGQIEVDATWKKLYDDWNLSKDKFGLIKAVKKRKLKKK